MHVTVTVLACQSKISLIVRVQTHKSWSIQNNNIMKLTSATETSITMPERESDYNLLRAVNKTHLNTNSDLLKKTL